MAEHRDRHEFSVAQRIAAVLALLLLLALGVCTVVLLFGSALAVVIGLVGSLLLILGGSWLVTKLLPRRLFGLIGAGLGLLLLFFALNLADSTWGRVVVSLLVLLAIVALQLTLARMALAGDKEPHDPDRSSGRPPPPSRPVLIYNEKSGDGKVVQFDIVARARALGVRTIAFDDGSNLAELARKAVAEGADCLGMAGGDGSQALVAAVALESGLPFVCIPAGTRNHFARDLGLDVTDPGSVLEAYVKGRLRRVDYGTVGDRIFVNNVSLGAYAVITQSPEYRDSKLATTLSLLPEIIGPDAAPVDLTFTTPDGEEIQGATVLLVSNNSYALGLSADVASRPSISDGLLGVLAVRAEKATDALAAVAQASLGLVSSSDTLLAFDVTEFEVRSTSSSVDAAIDGEALSLVTPLNFAIHQRGLTLLLPRSARHRKRSISLRRLIAVALARH